MDGTEVLDATGDIPGAVVSEANVVDKASGSECTVAVTSLLGTVDAVELFQFLPPWT